MIADALTTDVVEHLRTLIRFATSNPPGNDLPAARDVADTLTAAWPREGNSDDGGGR